MVDPSPSTDLHSRFLRGETSRAEGREVVRQLLLGTDGEASAERAVLPRFEASDYDAAFGRAIAAATAAAPAIEAERRSAVALAAELEAELDERPLEALSSTVAEAPRFANRSLSEALRERSFETGLSDPERAIALARLALVAAERALEKHGERLDHDALAGAWAQLGNALRVASEHREAERAFAEAEDRLAHGTGDLLVRARTLSLSASLASDRSQHRRAIESCRQAGRLYRRAGDRHGEGRMLIQEANLHVKEGDMATAIRRLEQAAERVDPSREPRLALVVAHNLVSYLDQQERYQEAWERLERTRALARELGHRLDLLRLRWLEGRVAAHRGLEAHAERCLAEARAAFVELGIAYDASLVALEMSALLARQGRRREMAELVEEMLPIFRSRQLHAEAQAALKVFCDAVRAESVKLATIREVTERLRRIGPGGSATGELG